MTPLRFRGKTLPYRGAKIDPDQRIVLINKMLRDYGIDQYQWTTLWNRNRVELRFTLEDERGTPFSVRLVAAPFLSNHRSWNAKTGKTEIVQAPNWKQSLALFHEYLKAKLAALAFGLRDIREEFLADTIVRDAEGVERTIAEVLPLALAAAGVQAPSLTGPQPERAPRVIDVEEEGRA